MAEVAEVTDDTFESEIVKSDRPAIVDFWAEWCAPCRAIAPIVQELAGRYGGQIRVVKLNVDENPSTAARYAVRALPTVLAFSAGRVVDQVVGARPKSAFEGMAEKLLAQRAG